MKRLILLLATAGLVMMAPAALAGGSCDFDGNGACDDADRDLLMSLQGAARGDADFRDDVDLDDDGVISLVDAAQWTQLRADQ